MVSKKRVPKQEKITISDSIIKKDEGTEVTPTMLPPTLTISVSDVKRKIGESKIQSSKCVFCNTIDGNFFGIVKISDNAVKSIVTVCGRDLRKVFKTETNGNVTFKMKEAYNF